MVEGLRKAPTMKLEEVSVIAREQGYRSYGDFTAELYRHHTTVEQYVRNGYKMNDEVRQTTTPLLRQDKVKLH